MFLQGQYPSERSCCHTTYRNRHRNTFVSPNLRSWRICTAPPHLPASGLRGWHCRSRLSSADSSILCYRHHGRSREWCRLAHPDRLGWDCRSCRWHDVSSVMQQQTVTSFIASFFIIWCGLNVSKLLIVEFNCKFK